MTLKASDYPTVRPALDLNFEQTKRLNPRITFSRASTGTYLDANGVLQSAPAGVARFDHNPVSGESLGLLLEPARTNLLTYSEQFDNAPWNLENATVTPNTDIAPDGTLTADKFVPTVGTAAHSFGRLVEVSASSAVSIYVKYVGQQFVQLHLGQSGLTLAWANFDILNGTAGTIGGYTLGSTITNTGNGWYRCSLVRTDSGVAALGLYTVSSASAGFATASTGDGISGIYIWGFQLETSPFPTSYIPTVASTVTRAADVCTVTNSNIYDTDSFTIINQPFGASTNDGSELTLFDGPEPIKRATVYSTDLSQTTINAAAGKTDEFWRWRVLGSSFALPNFATDGQVTVDWGDGTIETLTTAEHTFSNGIGYHDIGFRLDSGTYFRPYIVDNASIDTKVVALGPAPESMKLDAFLAFAGCSNLEAFDATVDATGGTNFTQAWYYCSSLTSFPLINTSAGTNFYLAWVGCSSLTSFPLIDTSSGTNFNAAWSGCSSLTSFPLIDTSAGTDFGDAWLNCSSLTSFPLIDTSAGINFYRAWLGCSSLTSFSLINTSSGTNFGDTWSSCSSLTSFPLIDTSSGTNFSGTWLYCTSLTSFPLINTAAGTNFYRAWYGCSSLTSFPLIDTSSGTNFNDAWLGCSSLTSFPLIDTAAGTNFQNTWNGCSNLTSFPLINTAAGTNFQEAWRYCSSLTSFPLIDTGAGTNFSIAWSDCTSLTSFPLINTAAGTNFSFAWYSCTSLTSFPLINTAAGTNFALAWYNCNSLTSFPLIDTAAGTNFQQSWFNCTSLTSFPLINTDASTTFLNAWQACSSLTDFPANFFDSWTGTPVNSCFGNTWYGCSALTATSVENILNSIDTSGQSAPASGVDIRIDYNTGTGTPSVATAITNLQSRGWTITLNGVLQ